MNLLVVLMLAGVLQQTACADEAKDKVPETFRVKFETTKGDFIIEVTRKWSPNGADRFHKMVKGGFYNDCAFFRVLDKFMAQFGINGDPKVQAKWRKATIKDDPVVASNKRGYITFAKSGAPNSRTTQLFINYGDNSRLDRSGFSPFGKVIDGMDVVDSLYNRYGEGAPSGRGPAQGKIQEQGNAYLKRSFPKLDYIKKVTMVKPGNKVRPKDQPAPAIAPKPGEKTGSSAKK